MSNYFDHLLPFLLAVYIFLLFHPFPFYQHIGPLHLQAGGHRRQPNLSLVFWATVCKTVRPMLLDRCLSCLSVTLVYCGQMVGWIKMPLGMEIGLGPGHIVLHGDPASPPPKGHGPSPNFRRMSIATKRLDGPRCHLVRW